MHSGTDADITNQTSLRDKWRKGHISEVAAAEGSLTSSTVFLLFISLRVSSTKLSQRPLQSSGSSEMMRFNIINVHMTTGSSGITNKYR